LEELKKNILKEFVATATREELLWISGYVQSALDRLGNNTIASEIKPSVNKITVLYGTETGNSKKVSTDLAALAKKKGIQVKLQGLEQYRLSDINREEYLFVVMSTQGEGEPPEAGKKFYDYLHTDGLNFPNIKYSVLALGDTSYPLYCKAGEDVDIQLEKAGAKRIAPLQKTDVDYDIPANEWIENVLTVLSKPNGVPTAEKPAVPVVAAKTKEKIIYKGTLLSKVNLHAKGSGRTTWHIELLSDDVAYEAGDTIGIVPPNNKEEVAKIIAIAGVKGSDIIAIKNDEDTIEEWLNKKLCINYLHETVVKKYAAIIGQEIPAVKIDLLDLLKVYPVADKNQFEEVLKILNKQTPRLYNIASTLTTQSGEVHITVARDEYAVNGVTKAGICSAYVDTLQENDTVEFFVQKNKRFRLPAGDKDIVMVGPGTGIAPFRSFLYERDATGAAGKNWLFFGEEHFTTDFLYQTEIQGWYNTGVLNKINVAFSKDHHVVYNVHHKMKEQAIELYNWLNNGAYFYLCGEKAPMGVEVEKTLIEIIAEQGKTDKEEALKVFNKWKEEGRYIKDVY